MSRVGYWTQDPCINSPWHYPLSYRGYLFTTHKFLVLKLQMVQKFKIFNFESPYLGPRSIYAIRSLYVSYVKFDSEHFSVHVISLFVPSFLIKLIRTEFASLSRPKARPMGRPQTSNLTEVKNILRLVKILKKKSCKKFCQRWVLNPGSLHQQSMTLSTELSRLSIYKS